MRLLITLLLPLGLACCGSAAKDSASNAASTQLAAATNTTQATEGNGLLPLDCGMGICFVSVVRNANLVNENSNGKLYKVMLSGAEIDESAVGSGGSVDLSKITFGDDSFSYIFCSTSLPAVMRDGKDGTDVEVLPFGDFVPHSHESSANLYAHICHPTEDWKQDDFAQKHGYKATAAASNFHLNFPTDILSMSAGVSRDAALELSKITDNDWDQLGTGCGCSFSKGQQTLLALGANGAIIRAESHRRICTPATDAYQSVVQGDGVLSCDSTRIEISNINSGKSNGDGFDANARLRVQYEGKTISLDGKLSCSC